MPSLAFPFLLKKRDRIPAGFLVSSITHQDIREKRIPAPKILHNLQHEQCLSDVNVENGHVCGFWYQSRPKRRLTRYETGKESHFTFGICSLLLIAVYCILMCANENPSTTMMMMMMMIYKGICVSVHEYQTNWSVMHVNLIRCKVAWCSCADNL